ncbi:unnamed protein product, partial [Leptidea sinapis]
MPSKSSRICSNHFQDTDRYTSNKGLTLLKNDAIPFIEAGINRNIQNTPWSLDHVSKTDAEEVFATPLESALKNRVSELIIKQKQLQKRNKVLSLRNKRLKKKNARLLEKLNDIKTNQVSEYCSIVIKQE